MTADNSISSGRFYCESCGRSYAWREPLAGKKVQCRCGQVMIAPDAPVPLENAPAIALQPPPQTPPPADPAEAEPGLYDLKDDDSPAVAAAPAAAVAAVPLPATTAKKPPAIPYRRGLTPSDRPTHDDLKDQLGGSVLRQIVVPATIALLGLALQVGMGVHREGPDSIGPVLAGAGVQLAVNLVLSFAAVAAAVKWFEISIGAPGPAALKLIALAIGPTAIAAFVGQLVGYDSFFVQIMVTSIVYLPLCFFGFMLLFEMDPPDAAYCTVMLYLVSQWALLFVA